jgi:hypothetical protein
MVFDNMDLERLRVKLNEVVESSKGIPFGPTLWKVRGRGLDLIGRGGPFYWWEEESKRNIEYMFFIIPWLHACV